MPEGISICNQKAAVTMCYGEFCVFLRSVWSLQEHNVAGKTIASMKKARACQRIDNISGLSITH